MTAWDGTRDVRCPKSPSLRLVLVASKRLPIILRRRSPASDCWRGIPISAALPPVCVHTECENFALARACRSSCIHLVWQRQVCTFFSRMSKRIRWAKRKRKEETTRCRCKCQWCCKMCAEYVKIAPSDSVQGKLRVQLDSVSDGRDDLRYATAPTVSGPCAAPEWRWEGIPVYNDPTTSQSAGEI